MELAKAGIRYRCEPGGAVFVLFANDTAEVDGLAQGSELLLRDAGGVTPRHSVYSNPRLRAEFGLGASGDEALLHPLQPAAPPVPCRRG
ncbi:MAG: FIG00931156: hypothetical protein [uncultured Ramlibacter sp.]|uniref:Uncharacterized protein n=1 Tax=uncultured Ramlibacter sp. TaxID=260755 RepID=A0A6J4QLJ4_9BURK|nr:MAG: FIG00931156: hypothetical protein [uncultured Ramlibacter sp.]